MQNEHDELTDRETHAIDDGAPLDDYTETPPPGAEEPSTVGDRMAAEVAGQAGRTETVPIEYPDDEEPAVEDTGKGPYAPAESALAALKVALRACPRKAKDQPDVACLTIHFDAERSRIAFAGRDGRRWHMAFVTMSHPLMHRDLCLSLQSAKELRAALDYAVRSSAHFANLRFTGDLTARLFTGKRNPLLIELEEFERGRGAKGWQPPRFVKPSNPGAAWADYDAKSIADATSWPGGSAVVKRDETDDAGRRHITLTDSAGDELLRAVTVPRGQTDGLPEDRQMEIAGTLTPKGKAEAKKKPRTPKAEAKRVGGPGKKTKAAPIVHRGRKAKKGRK